MPKPNDGLPNEEDILAKGADDNELEVSIVDDTPEQDRGRTPLSKEKLKQALEPTDEELEKYSEDVKKRILQLRHAAHDQRRLAEEAQREREAAIQFAQAQQRKAKDLEQKFVAGEKVFVGGMQEKAKVSIEAARSKLKAATEAFDADAIVDATQELNKALFEEQRYASWQPRTPSQEEEDVVQTRATEPQRPSVPKPDARAVAWADKNKWFGSDDEMTGFAYGVDARLAKQGITAATDPDAYYGAIDRRMREAFPDKFETAEDRTEQREAPQRQQETSRTPVAPVRRSSSGKRVVTLTKSQEQMARKLGLTAQQYAAEIIALENRNG